MKTEPASSSLKFVVAAVVVLPVVLRLLAPSLPFDRLWGFDMLRDLPALQGIAIALLPLLALLVFIPRFQHSVAAASERHGRGAAVLVLLCLLLAALFRPMESFFYGDGGLLIPQIHRFSIDSSYDAELLLNLKSSPLAGVLLTGAMQIIPTVSSALGLGYPTTALYPFLALSLIPLLGVSLYILIALPRREQPGAALLTAGSAGALLFFGYVEYYAPVYAALLVFLIAGERSLRSAGSLRAAILAFVAAVAAHYLALALLPVLLYLIAFRYPTSLPAATVIRHPFRTAFGLLALFFLFYVAAGFWNSDSRIFMPGAEVAAASGTLRYTLFSTWHLADFVNLIMLLAPSAAVLLVLVPFMRNDSGRSALSTGTRFGLLSVIFLAAFIFFANTSLGLARDWDIAAPLGTAMLFTAMLLLKQRSTAAMLVLGAASVLLTLPWIAVNTSSTAVSSRFERIVQLDDKHMYGDYALSGYEALRKFYRSKGNSNREIDLTRRMVEILDYPLHYRELLASAAELQGESAQDYDNTQRWMLSRLIGKAETLRREGVQRDYSIGLDQIDSLAQGIGVQALTLRVPFPKDLLGRIAGLTRSGRSWPGIDGMQAYARKDFAAAADLLNQALNSGFESPTLYLFSGNALALTGQHAAALQRLEEGTALFPADAMLRFTLGKYYARAGIRLTRARELLLWCLDSGLPAGRRDEISAILTSIQGRE